jgi:beta-mannosidase
MDRSREISPNGLTRRSVLKLPVVCWLTSLFGGESIAKALAADAVSSAGALARRTTSLNGAAWSLTYGACPDYPRNTPQTAPPADWPTVPATVPGNVEIDLAAAGKIEPLEKGNRVLQALKLEDYQWWYKRKFQAGHGEPGEKAELVFEGLDCIATVWLNGTEVGKSANMLVAQRFDVTQTLLPGQMNEVVVRIDPAVPAGLAYPHSGWEHPANDHWESL